MSVVINSLTVDCHDPRALAEFWTAAWWHVVDESDEGAMIAPFTEPQPGVFPVHFAGESGRQGRQEPMALRPCAEDQAAEADGWSRSARGTPTSVRVTWPGGHGRLEGNEFCVLRSLPKEAAA